jgi:hypothetical protein
VLKKEVIKRGSVQKVRERERERELRKLKREVLERKE